MKGVLQHSNVSLDWLQEALDQGKSAGIVKQGVALWPLERQQDQVRQWRAQGYTFAPACDNLRPDGHCAGHRPAEGDAVTTDGGFVVAVLVVGVALLLHKWLDHKKAP